MALLRTALVPELVTPRLLLRQPLEADLADLFPISFYNGKPAANLEEAKQMLQQIEEDVKQGYSHHWGIILQESNRLIGTCGFYRGITKKTGEIGYVMREEHRRKGFALEAVLALLTFGFTTLKLQKIEAFTDADNTASVNLLLKAGFKEFEADTAQGRSFRLCAEE